MSEYGTRNHNVSGGRSTTLPGLGRVPRDASPELKRYLEALQEIIEVRNGFRGDVRDRAITLRELIASGLAKDLESVPFDPNNPTGQNVGFQPTNPIPDSETPTTPTNLAVSAGFGVLKVSWTYPNNYAGHSHTDVFRSTSNNRANAVFIGLSEGAMFVDATVSASTQYYYWVRHVSISGEDGSYAGPVNATLQPDVNVLLSTLSGAITSTQLASSLATPIANNTTSVSNLNGQYMVKIASADAGGGQHVAGFGLSNTNALNGTPTSAFIVAADKFAVVNATNHAVGATNSPAQANTPFIVTTSAETIDGVTIPVGVYIQDAFINSARITELLAGSIKADYVVADSFMSSPRIEAMQINMGTMNKGLTTSTTSRALAGSGANSTFAITGTPTPTYNAGETLRCVPDANTALYMDVRVVTFSGGTLTYKPVRTTGSGTFNAWKITHQNPAKWTISNSNTRTGSFSIDASGVMHANTAKLSALEVYPTQTDLTNGTNVVLSANGTIAGAFIANASVNTLAIAGNAVTVPAGDSASSLSINVGNSYTDASGFTTLSQWDNDKRPTALIIGGQVGYQGADTSNNPSGPATAYVKFVIEWDIGSSGSPSYSADVVNSNLTVAVQSFREDFGGQVVSTTHIPVPATFSGSNVIGCRVKIQGKNERFGNNKSAFRQLSRYGFFVLGSKR